MAVTLRGIGAARVVSVHTVSVSRGPFPIVNRLINPLVAVAARTPLRPLFGPDTVLLTVTGRKTGKQFTFPVWAVRRDGGYRISIGASGRKVWWRNLTGEGGPVTIERGGVVEHGHAVATGDPVRVYVTLN